MVRAKCIHEKEKRYCRDPSCGGGQAFCKHDIRKERCDECGGGSLCIHKIDKYKCYLCGGSGFCKHNRRKDRCDDCILESRCEHGKSKFTCDLCKAEHQCEHGKTREKCYTCNPTYLHCEHGITKYMCKPCGGSAFCIHEKYKTRCKPCGGSSLCKSEWCDKLGIKKYNGYCLTCCIHLCPDIEVIRNYKTKENNVVDHVMANFPDFSWVADKRIQDGCSFRRPDLLLDLGTHIIIVEVDEDKHEGYECICENKRIMEISQDVNHRPIVFVRFNPDGYTDIYGNKIKSCWKLNKMGVVTIPKSKKAEWDVRIQNLIQYIQYWVDNPSEKTIEIVELYYDECD